MLLARSVTGEAAGSAQPRKAVETVGGGAAAMGLRAAEYAALCRSGRPGVLKSMRPWDLQRWIGMRNSKCKCPCGPKEVTEGLRT